jgi:hypothetical protein
MVLNAQCLCENEELNAGTKINNFFTSLKS